MAGGASRSTTGAMKIWPALGELWARRTAWRRQLYRRAGDAAKRAEDAAMPG